MRKTRFYTRIVSGFLALWLLFLATGGQAVSASKQVVKSEKVTEKKAQDTEQQEVKVQALALEAVVSPALSFDFSQEFYFQTHSFCFEYQTAALVKCFAVFYFYFSFFRHVFGIYIAINAP